MSSLHEECGVFGVYSKTAYPIGRTVYYGLYALQHRGQESSGIVVNDDGVFYSYKDIGLVNEVFSKDSLAKMPSGSIAVGHVRYGTTGGTNRSNCQPIEVNHMKGQLALAHNGNLCNAFELRSGLELGGAIFHATSDSEVIAYIITQERLKVHSIEEAVSNAMYKLDGAYSLVMMSATKLLAARDPYGFRPLCYGVTKDGTYIVSSESCGLSATGAKFIRDVEPGEIIVIDAEGVHSFTEHCGKKSRHACIFEYIYFARPDSVIDGVSVHSSRMRAGALLAKAHPVEADVVVGVPDSGLDAALGYSIASGIPYGIGLIKNKYIGRTFISPEQEDRVDKIRIKLNPIRETIEGKRVVLVDDSIVRGNTSKQIVNLIREAGAKEVHMRISSPPFLNPCYYGTDIDSRKNLIACQHTLEETTKIIGADTLGYLPLDELHELIGSYDYCSACFDGKYPTPIPVNTSKSRFETKLSDRVKK